MIDLLLVAIVCTTNIPPGDHVLQCTAYYKHTLPNGNQYTNTAQEYHIGASVDVTCLGEGYPYKVVLLDNGVQACKDEDGMIFSDGFERGTTGAWK